MRANIGPYSFLDVLQRTQMGFALDGCAALEACRHNVQHASGNERV